MCRLKILLGFIFAATCLAEPLSAEEGWFWVDTRLIEDGALGSILEVIVEAPEGHHNITELSGAIAVICDEVVPQAVEFGAGFVDVSSLETIRVTINYDGPLLNNFFTQDFAAANGACGS